MDKYYLSDNIVLKENKTYYQDKQIKRHNWHIKLSELGWEKLHKTAHRDNSGKYPAGANLNYLDGHVGWQKATMEGRKLVGLVERTYGGPVFYW